LNSSFSTSELRNFYPQHPNLPILQISFAVMASAKDVKDMLGVAAGNGTPKPTVKKPVKVPGAKRLSTFCNVPVVFLQRLILTFTAGINREVLALHGDRAPPISVLDPAKSFKGKLKRDFKPARWYDTAPGGTLAGG
jgi:hypothetical protein